MIEEDISKSADEMDEQFINEYMEAADTDTFEAFAEDWGMTVEEAHKAALDFSALDGFVPEDVTLSETAEVVGMSSEDFTPDYTATAEYEGDGITSEFLPGDSMVADTVAWLADKAGVPPEAAMLMAGIAGKNPKNIKKGAEGMFTPRKNKGNQLTDKRGTKSGEVVGDTKVGGPGVPVGKPTKGGLPVKRKEQGLDVKKEQGLATRGVDAKIGLTKRNAEKAVAGTLTGGLIANRMLSGNRDAEGNLIPIGKSYSGGPTFEGYPEVEEGNQFGYHKKEGQNFWTVNNDDAYWDTHEMGTGDAWSDAELKKAPAKELDWSSWFN